ncbi:murein biosynthesis integral membrane protein MurJ [Hydrogenothermus marinus]|uniref:Probable lipid II flippase MurJ n=1 Tax=Hydrogenothermus marinus TaxID=133270 RepID=A0A3M0C496_9AQUI|nr:murein biosynthesis integral membrane protein MurJ [Hydrogenothermus marinus]RMA97792.1 putative peptidoglycan lipid II flippase [Hydrogenothermus marinus]
MQSSFFKNTFVFSIATFISRILGYVRDATIAYVFGASYLTDAFFVAWRLPNTLRQLVAEGSFNAAFIPIYTNLIKKNPDKAKAYLSSLFSYYVLILSIITFFAVIFSKILILILAPGFSKSPEILNLASNLVKIVFPYLILVGIVSFFMAVLNTKDKFFIPAVSPAFLNLSFIFFALFLSSYFGIYSIAFGALFGGFLQILLTYTLFKKEGFYLKPNFQKVVELKTTLKRILPAFASFGVSQFGFVIDTILASLIMAGAISYLYYGNRIFQLPIGIFAIGLGNALLVSLSRHYAENNLKAFSKDLNEGLKLSLIISIPASFGMIVLGKEIIQLLFAHGKFSEKDTIYTFYALTGYSIGLIFYTMTRPLKSAFFAIEDVKTPLYSTIAGILGGILFAIIFVFIFNLGVFGLSFASSISGLISLIYLFYFYPYEILKKDIFKTFLKALFSAFLMSFVILLLKPFISNLAILVFGMIFISIIIYFSTLYVLKEKLVLKIFEKVRRKL